MSFSFRTDLAVEMREAYKKAQNVDMPGVTSEEESTDEYVKNKMRVSSNNIFKKWNKIENWGFRSKVTQQYKEKCYRKLSGQTVKKPWTWGSLPKHKSLGAYKIKKMRGHYNEDSPKTAGIYPISSFHANKPFDLSLTYNIINRINKQIN